eukprot:TRINITY_DN20748_c0_g2_i1.p1 TRINITY_DN20748_c0_g2~~TRINITY_DN20748_c0_g2_i1.p1  ORF type:complete len:317 (+),score=84.29 TRINITY_DN20748_c0_g2_i1:61-951(+)
MGKKFDPAALLKKQGWTEGEGLGKGGQGITSYVKVSMKAGNYGIGADRSVFVAEERAQFSSILDDTLANVRKENKRRKKMEKAGLSSEQIEEKQQKKKQKEAEKAESQKPNSKAAAAGFIASGKVVNGVLQSEQQKEKRPAADSDTESSCSDSSSDAGPSKPIEQMSDAELFAACGGARMGKRGACHNSKKIERIRQQESDIGAKLVAKARARWALKRGSRSPHRSPVSAPVRSPALPKRATPLMKAKTPPTKPLSPKKSTSAKKEKKQKKDKKEKKSRSEKKEKKSKKDKRRKTD